jgi:hypothetical protein
VWGGGRGGLVHSHPLPDDLQIVCVCVCEYVYMYVAAVVVYITTYLRYQLLLHVLARLCWRCCKNCSAVYLHICGVAAVWATAERTLPCLVCQCCKALLSILFMYRCAKNDGRHAAWYLMHITSVVSARCTSQVKGLVQLY